MPTPPPTSDESVKPISLEELPLLLQRSLVFDGLADGVILTDPHGEILDWSAGAERMFGWSREEVLGKTPAILHRTDEALVLTDSINETAIREGRWSGEIIFIRKDGTTGVCETTTVPLKDSDGRIMATVGINRDITEQKRAEAKLLEERRLLRQVIDLIPDPIFFKDTEGRQILQNAANARNFGLESVDHTTLQGKTVWDFPFPKEYAEQYAADDQRVLRTGQPVINREEPYQRADGSSGWLLTSKYPIRDAEGTITGLLGICREITSFRQAADELDTTRRRFFELVQNSPLGLIEWSPDMKVRHWLGRAPQFFGWNAEEVVGKTFGSWPFVHPDDIERVYQIAGGMRDGGQDRNICINRNLTKSGAVIHCEWHNSVMRDSSGKVVAILSLVEDITERIKAEEERSAMQNKLQEAQKLESLGILAGGIAHDFNNLLTAILGHASLAAAEAPENELLRESLSQIENAALRAADLCHQMLAYSGKGRFFLEELDLNQVLSETTDLLRVSISKKAALRFALAPELPAIVGDATQIRQVVMNLIINASEAIEASSGCIGIRTTRKSLGAEELKRFQLGNAEPGEFVGLHVSDTGSGMSAEVLAKIFDPFFTTKFTGRGLGLAAVMGIVRSHGGALHVSSVPGSGTSFSIYFPTATSTAIRTPTESPVCQTEWKGHGTILVIDDEESVRTTLSRMLEVIGFNVLTAADGCIGLTHLASPQGSEIRLVILDLTMPHLDGEETYRELRKINTEVPVLLISGYTESEMARRFMGHEVSTFLQKPFHLNAVKERLRQILD